MLHSETGELFFSIFFPRQSRLISLLLPMGSSTLEAQ